MSKKVLITRIISWCILAGIAPVVFIAWRYQLFGKVTKMNIGGWGLIAIVIAGVFIFVVGKYIKKAMDVKWSMAGQCVSGIFKVLLPLIGVYVCLYCVKDNLENFLQALLVVIVCEALAIPVNPMPQWVYELSKGETQDIFEFALNKKEKEEK